jgi:hypothetical protein
MPPFVAAAARRWPCLGGAALLLLAAPAVGQEPPAPDPAFTSDLLADVADDTPLAPAWLNRQERLAYDLLVLHARKMPSAALRKAARRDLTFAHLFGPDRAKYRGQVVHVEGQLRWLLRSDPPESVREFGEPITDLYEGWVHLNHYGGVFVCVLFTELQPGLKPAEVLNVPVAFDAYFFKRISYETRETPKTTRLAPLLIGRTITPRPEPADAGTLWAVPGAVLAGTLGLAGGAIGAGLAVAWWFRREDRKVRARLRLARPAAFADAEPPPLNDASEQRWNGSPNGH